MRRRQHSQWFSETMIAMWVRLESIHCMPGPSQSGIDAQDHPDRALKAMQSFSSPLTHRIDSALDSYN